MAFTCQTTWRALNITNEHQKNEIKKFTLIVYISQLLLFSSNFTPRKSYYFIIFFCFRSVVFQYNFRFCFYSFYTYIYVCIYIIIISYLYNHSMLHAFATHAVNAFYAQNFYTIKLLFVLAWFHIVVKATAAIECFCFFFGSSKVFHLILNHFRASLVSDFDLHLRARFHSVHAGCLLPFTFCFYY